MYSRQKWTTDKIPDQTGRVAIITGANSGTGFETALAMANKGATVVMACRNFEKANPAADQIHQANPSGKIAVMELDLADQESVRRFAAEFRDHFDRLDLLVNNAGIMKTPYGKTTDGFELQFGTNHLGHFALTGLLLDLIIGTSQARVVTVSSQLHRCGKIDFDNLNAEQSYNKSSAYYQSKLANLLFTYEMQRKLAEAGKDARALAAHPGWTATRLQRHSTLGLFLSRFFAQEPSMGALPTLMAATDPNVNGGEYFGPRGFVEARGYPRRVSSSGRSHDQEVAAKLWEVSEELTGVQFGALSRKQGVR